MSKFVEGLVELRRQADERREKAAARLAEREAERSEPFEAEEDGDPEDVGAWDNHWNRPE